MILENDGDSQRALRLMVISHALTQAKARARWQLLGTQAFCDVEILTPRIWQSTWLGEKQTVVTQHEVAEHFKVIPCETTSCTDWCRYRIKRFARELFAFRPDVIFCIHEEGIRQLLQTIVYRRLFARRAKLVYFSMTVAPRVPSLRRWSPRELLKRIYLASQWWAIRHGTDACVAHYPAIEERLRKDGYRKPVLLQTQIGVDTREFRPDVNDRFRQRQALGLSGFTVGFAGRLCHDKGVMDVVNAVVGIPGEWHLLLVGDGECRQLIESRAKTEGWSSRLHITGQAPLDEVPAFMRAMDAFVIASRETTQWVDTFPLVVAQAMATGLPVVGARSGAIPFQLGGKGLLFEQQDIPAIRAHLESLALDEGLRLRLGMALLQEASARFSIEALNDNLIGFLRKSVLRGSEFTALQVANSEKRANRV